MTPDQFNRCRTLFNQLAAIAPAERPAALLAACPDDSLVCREVETLLNQGEGANPLDGLTATAKPIGADETVGEPPPGHLPGDWVGGVADYRVVGLLGEGGMGAVYEAEQASPRRRVALKVIRPGLATKETLRRFELEKEVLGRLEHPCIARIYEAGTADAGHGQQPYFAMELVSGLPLVRHANEAQLDIRSRVELLAKVCDAVHHAHQKGVVHRDLKPANILVNGDGLPKILDFGVARLVDSQAGGLTTDTRTGHILGTLQYMSPEQAAGEVKSIDTRSDVYALGLIAYELLGGRRPYNLDSRALPDALRAIQEEEPSRLGTIVRSLRGDLETIVGKAMEKERERRYASAAELSTDLRRFLHYEPIAARPPGTWYNLRKFARRNRTLVSGVAATFVVLVGGIAATSTALVRESRQRTAADRSAARAAASEAATSRALAQVSAEAGRALEQRGRWGPAIAKYREALAAGHADRLGLRLRIVRCLTNSLKRRDSAAELAGVERDFASVAGTQPELLFARGDAISIEDPAKSRLLLEKSLSRGLTGPDADYAQGLLAEDVPTARAWFEKAVARDPFHHDANAMLALTLLLEGRLKDAESRLDLWQQSYPESPTPVLLRALHAIMSRDDAAVARRLREAEGHVLPRDLTTLRRFADLVKAARQGRSGPQGYASVILSAAALAAPTNASGDTAENGSLADFRRPRCLDRLPSLSYVLFQLSRGSQGSIALLDSLAKAVPALQGAALSNDVTAVSYDKLRRADPETIRTLERAIALPEVLVEHHESARLLLIGIHALAAATSPNDPNVAEHRTAIARVTRDQLAAGGFTQVGGNWPNLATMVAVSRDWELTLQVSALSDAHVGPSAAAALARGRAEYELGNYGRAILALDSARQLNPNANAAARDALRRDTVERLGMLGPPVGAMPLAAHDGLDPSPHSGDRRPASREASQPASIPSW